MENGNSLQPSGIKVQSVFLPLLPQSAGCSVLFQSLWHWSIAPLSPCSPHPSFSSDYMWPTITTTFLYDFGHAEFLLSVAMDCACRCSSMIWPICAKADYTDLYLYDWDYTLNFILQIYMLEIQEKFSWSQSCCRNNLYRRLPILCLSLHLQYVSCWCDLIFYSVSSRWKLNGPHHVEALSDCLQAAPAELGKVGQKNPPPKSCGDFNAKTVYEEVCDSVTIWRPAATAWMWKSVCLYVQTCMQVCPSERVQTLTNVTDEIRGCIATV